MNPIFDFLIVFLLILISGLFAASELALVSLRTTQIDEIVAETKRGKRVAKLAKDPNRFLSSAQIGVTVISLFSASYGAETIKPHFVPFFQSFGIDESVSGTIALIVLTLIISYLSLVFGELVPKRLALQKNEGISLAVAAPLDVFATIMRPVIWLLSISTNFVFRLIGGDPNVTAKDISGAELHSIVENSEEIEDEEREILSGVFDAASRSVSEVMRPRGDVKFLDGDMALVDAAVELQDLPYSRYPVIGEGFDDVLGFIHIRDVLDTKANKGAKTVRDVTRSILKFPGTNQLFPSMQQMRDKGIHIAIVLDEYGGTDGICTLEDIIEEMIGEIRDEYDLRENPELRAASDGSYSVDGGMSLNDFEDETGIAIKDGPYETVAGYLLANLGHIASVGESVETEQCILTVSRIDNMRIARVKVKPNLNESSANKDGNA